MNGKINKTYNFINNLSICDYETFTTRTKVGIHGKSMRRIEEIDRAPLLTEIDDPTLRFSGARRVDLPHSL